jgi:hypothetical protein
MVKRRSSEEMAKEHEGQYETPAPKN